MLNIYHYWGFPDSSVGKESACSAGDPSSIPGSERSAGEGIGYPFQHSPWCCKESDITERLSLTTKVYILSIYLTPRFPLIVGTNAPSFLFPLSLVEF